MASASLERWRGARADLIDQLIAAHVAVGGTAAGRRWTTEALNRALVLQLGAQFQGFARDLHEETAVVFAKGSGVIDPTIARIVSSGLQSNLRLDRNNARSDVLDHDFGRFGIRLLSAMKDRDKRTSGRLQRIEWFNRARNGLAHEVESKIAHVEAAGYRISLGQVRRWRSALDGLAATMDVVLADHLARLFKTARPW